MAIRAQPIAMGLKQITGLADAVDDNDAVNKAQLDAAVAGLGTGTVTSIAVSGGTTGLTTSGGPITTSGTITVAGTLIVANGGTGLATLTANNVILGAGTSTPTFVAPGTSGNLLTSNGTTWTSAAATWTLIKKTTTQTVTASNTFADDSVLQFSVGANKKYAFRGQYSMNCTTGGYKFAVNGPSSPTLIVVNYTGSTPVTAYNTALASYPGTGRVFLEFRGIIQNVNAGTLVMRIAQDTASGSTNFELGSYLEWMEIV